MFYLSEELREKLSEQLARLNRLSEKQSGLDPTFLPLLNEMKTSYRSMLDNSTPFHSDDLAVDRDKLRSIITDFMDSCPNTFKISADIKKAYHDIPILNRGLSRSDFVEFKALFQESKELLKDIRDNGNQFKTLFTFHLNIKEYLDNLDTIIIMSKSLLKSSKLAELCHSLNSNLQALIILGSLNLVSPFHKIDPEISKATFNDLTQVKEKLETTDSPDRQFLNTVKEYEKQMLTNNPGLNASTHSIQASRR